MPGATLTRIGKRFGAVQLFDGFDLSVGDGEFVVVVGPSGCGKSTLLRLVAGLESPDEGTIHIGARRIDRLPPGERGVAMVFQSYALYPQMTVAQNIGFPLRMAGRPRAAIERAVARACDMLGLSDLAGRRPAQLSGGQRQRVAIGRAIVREPDLFLFDEPLSNLDAGLRARMRREFAELHARLGTTTIYVTHDQAEAMALADRIVLLRDGGIEQHGTPEELYHRPASLFAARFFGQPAINALPARVVQADDNGLEVATGHEGERMVLPPRAAGPLPAGSRVTLAVRPEALAAAPGDGRVRFAPRAVAYAEWFGGERHVGLGTGDGALTWRAMGGPAPETGAAVTLWAEAHDVLVFAPDGQAMASAPLPRV
ncbi:MAG: ABC transporter ATP-binding protein [Pseudomonadota bacterium]|nr:ABC transporter ATP-binding protein [Pseudomonadota bacterium]